jgi:hypothetical protein
VRRLEARVSATEAQGRIAAVAGEIIVDGDLDDGRIEELRVAAEGCRISRALSVPVTVRLTPVTRA